MAFDNANRSETYSAPNVLATDLDGTLIPLAGHHENLKDLDDLAGQLAEHDVTLVFVTGRHFESVERAIRKFSLPIPHWIICDVGSSLYKLKGETEFEFVSEYSDHLQDRMQGKSLQELGPILESLDELRLQEREKQGPFKLSFYCAANRLEQLRETISNLLIQQETPGEIIVSEDPFNGDGLVDILPSGVSKSYALQWWSTANRIAAERIVFAGDSGNDWAALTHGYRAVVVGNASSDLKHRVRSAHETNGWSQRLFVADVPGTSGVLAGCRSFGLFGDAPSSAPTP